MRQPLLLLCALAATPAAAQQDKAVRSFAVNGYAPQVCAVQPPRLAPGTQVNFVGLNGSTLRIDHLVDPTTLSTSAASIEIGLDAVCNYPHRIVLETQNNGLYQTNERPAAPPPGFGHAIPYSATMAWGMENLRLVADATIRRIAERSLSVNHPAAGTILLRLEIQPGASNERQNAPLLAGYYSDTLRVIVEPQQ